MNKNSALRKRKTKREAYVVQEYLLFFYVVGLNKPFFSISSKYFNYSHRYFFLPSIFSLLLFLFVPFQPFCQFADFDVLWNDDRHVDGDDGNECGQDRNKQSLTFGHRSFPMQLKDEDYIFLFLFLLFFICREIIHSTAWIQNDIHSIASVFTPAAFVRIYIYHFFLLFSYAHNKLKWRWSKNAQKQFQFETLTPSKIASG